MISIHWCEFFFKDIAKSVVFALSLFSGATASAAYASDNADYYDRIENRCDGGRVRGDLCDDVETIRDSEGATAVSCMFTISTLLSH